MGPWTWLILAILFEVSGTICLKLSSGFSKLVPSLLTGFFYIISFSLLALALKKMEVGLAYAIWSGLGTGLIAIIGIFLFGESSSYIKLTSLILIILGVIGLNLAGGTH
jgi:small multidrug resistance pump